MGVKNLCLVFRDYSKNETIFSRRGLNSLAGAAKQLSQFQANNNIEYRNIAYPTKIEIYNLFPSFAGETSHVIFTLWGFSKKPPIFSPLRLNATIDCSVKSSFMKGGEKSEFETKR